jgi:hypothetical protein
MSLLRLSVLIVAFCLIAGAIRANSLQAPPQQPSTLPMSADKQSDNSPKPPQPRSNPDGSGKYHVGDGVTAPILVYSEEPEFSEKMIKKHLLGSCVVSLTIDIAGNSHDVHLVKSIPDASDKRLRGAVLEMQDQCVKTVKQYRFKPATFEGKPVPVDLNIEISFNRM